MIRVGLIDVDGHNFPNLALMKLSSWHKQQGDFVEWYDKYHFFETGEKYDIVYQAKVFDESYSPDIDFLPMAKKIIKGGTGYGLDNKLPFEVEHCMPDYGLYGITDTAYGFLTRGCPRNCSFCIVGKKEGLCSQKVADLNEFWSGQPNIVLLDPNLLACKQREELLDQLINSCALVDFSQGLDIRLTNAKIVDKLNRLRVKRLHFAWDNPKEDLTSCFAAFADAYKRKSADGKVVYVLVNFGSTMDENLHRIYTLRDLGFDPYVMVYDKPNAPKEIRRLQRWCNNRIIFGSCERFEDYKD